MLENLNFVQLCLLLDVFLWIVYIVWIVNKCTAFYLKPLPSISLFPFPCSLHSYSPNKFKCYKIKNTKGPENVVLQISACFKPVTWVFDTTSKLLLCVLQKHLNIKNFSGCSFRNVLFFTFTKYFCACLAQQYSVNFEYMCLNTCIHHISKTLTADIVMWQYNAGVSSEESILLISEGCNQEGHLSTDYRNVKSWYL